MSSYILDDLNNQFLDHMCSCAVCSDLINQWELSIQKPVRVRRCKYDLFMLGFRLFGCLFRFFCDYFVEVHILDMFIVLKWSFVLWLFAIELMKIWVSYWIIYRTVYSSYYCVISQILENLQYLSNNWELGNGLEIFILNPFYKMGCLFNFGTSLVLPCNPFC